MSLNLLITTMQGTWLFCVCACGLNGVRRVHARVCVLGVEVVGVGGLGGMLVGVVGSTARGKHQAWHLFRLCVGR